MESEVDKSFSQTMLQQTQQRATGQNDAAIAQREREINDIAKGIIELSDIFRELQTMIIDQGTMLDRIDYNVERMGTEVKAAEKELKVVGFCTFIHLTLWFIGSRRSINIGTIGNELPTTFREAKDHAPLSSRGDRSDHRSGGETKETQLSGFRTRGGVLKQHQVCARLGRQSKETPDI